MSIVLINCPLQQLVIPGRLILCADVPWGISASGVTDHLILLFLKTSAAAMADQRQLKVCRANAENIAHETFHTVFSPHDVVKQVDLSA